MDVSTRIDQRIAHVRRQPILDRIDRLQTNTVVRIVQCLQQHWRIAFIAKVGKGLDRSPTNNLVTVTGRSDKRIAAHVRRQPVLEAMYALKDRLSPDMR